jgi:hypothetical protein
MGHQLSVTSYQWSVDGGQLSVVSYQCLTACFAYRKGLITGSKGAPQA